MDILVVGDIVKFSLLIFLLSALIGFLVFCFKTWGKNGEQGVVNCCWSCIERFLCEIVFTRWAENLNNFFRKYDYRFAKSYGHGELFRKFFHEGYPTAAYLLIGLALFFLFAGLNPGITKEFPAAFVLACIVTVIISKLVAWVEKKIPAHVTNWFLSHLRYHALHIISSLVIITLSVAMWWYLDKSEKPVIFYKHIHIPVIIALLVLSLAGIGTRKLVFRKSDDLEGFSAKLQCTNLVKDDGKLQASWSAVMFGLFSGPTYHILTLLLWPSWIIVWIPTSWMDQWVIWTLLGFCWLILAMCTVHRQLKFVTDFMKRWFLTGGQLFVSLLIIILAAARIFDISYISTLLDGAPIPNILFFMLASYSSFLLYEFWINSLLCHHLIYYLRNNRHPDSNFLSRIPYTYVENCQDAGRDPQQYDYCLQIYSGARFALVKSHKCESNGMPDLEKGDLHLFEKQEVFKLIARKHKDLNHAYHDLSKRVMLYFSLQNALLLAIVVWAVLWVLRHEPQPMVVAQHVTSEKNSLQPIDLKKLVLEKSSEGKPAIFVAASGGGTRAAIYTTAVLAALRERKQLDNVVLSSGVSGGGMSLAYFSANRQYLLRDEPQDCSEKGMKLNAWCDYLDVVSDNHIRYVASHIGNTDIYTDTSLGYYLAKSFDMTFARHSQRVESDKSLHSLAYYKYLDEIQGMGLILNTALVGHPYTESETLVNALSKHEKKLNQSAPGGNEKFYKIQAGGRLIFTNLKSVDKFPGNNADSQIADARDVEFKYLIGGGNGIALPTIGALTANFPPVFPNAIVKFDEKRYRVTDGGAVENRGLVSLLYAMRSMLEALSEEELKKLPALHVVMIEASGESIDYRNYMTGLTAKSNSSVMIANQLILELKDIMKAKCRSNCKDKLVFHYLSMPLMMRARGGLGTHWKMPSTVNFRVSSLDEGTPDQLLTLQGHDTICLMQELFASDITNRSAPEISVDISSESEHIHCQPTQNRLLRAAFLDDNTDTRKSWLRLERELTN